MGPLCVICQEYFSPADENIVITPCGHILHFACLDEWTPRSATCPQCREPLLTVKKVYFSFPMDNSIVERNRNLQHEVENLKFENNQWMRMSEDLEKLNVELKADNKALKTRLDDLEKENLNVEKQKKILTKKLKKAKEASKVNSISKKFKNDAVKESLGMCLRSGFVKLK